MKRTMQFLIIFTALLLVSYQSQAGVKSANRKDGLGPITFVIIDENGKPAPNVWVYAACTGLPAAFTDATGTVTFKVTGSCKCEGAQAEIKTSTGCDNLMPMTCGNNYATACPE